MVKIRTASYCNLKAFLIYLVIYAHLIEGRCSIIYRLIYAFHMPLFAMITGYFCQNHELKRAKSLLLCYVITQTAAVLFGKTELLTPYWHLWYLLSSATWAIAGRILKRFPVRRVLILSVMLGCIVGLLPWVGRELSLSRTIVFFPYYWAGKCRLESGTRGNSIVYALIAVAALLICPFPTSFLYQAKGYQNGMTDGLYRLLCYVIGAALSNFCLAWAPDRKFFFTKIGTDTYYVYLLHAPLVLLLRRYYLPIWLCAIISAGIVFSFYKLWQGGRYFCGIATQQEGRNQ